MSTLLNKLLRQWNEKKNMQRFACISWYNHQVLKKKTPIKEDQVHVCYVYMYNDEWTQAKYNLLQ